MKNNQENNNLTKKICTFSDLVSGKSVQLRVNAQQDHFYGSDEDDDIEDEMDLKKYEEACDKWREAEFVDKTFDELRLGMTDIGQGVYKKVLQEGFGDPIPDKNAKVTIMYSVFFEKTLIPVDSTVLTGKDFSFITGSNSGLLYGIELGVMTMMAQEQAQFIVPYQYLYGEIGCPPRIPPKKDGLILIRVKSIEPGCGDEETPEQEIKTFSSAMKKVEELRRKAKMADTSARQHLAARTYHEAIKILLRIDAYGEDEDRQRNEMVGRFLIYAGMMYNKLQQPKSACIDLNEAMKYITNIPIDLKGKLFLHRGRAMRLLGEYDRAKKDLMTAQKYSNSPIIRNEMELVIEAKKKYDTNIAKMMQQHLSLGTKADKRELSKINKEFESGFKETVKRFLEDGNVKRQVVAEDFKPEQRKIVDDVLLMFPNVVLSVMPTDNATKYCLVKTD